MKKWLAFTYSWVLKYYQKIISVPVNIREIKIERNVWIFLLFFGLSTFFWFLKALNDDYETTLKYPVKYTNIPDKIIIENELPNVLLIKVRDKGFALLRYKSYSSFMFLTNNINLKNVIKNMNSQNNRYKVVLNSNTLKTRISKQLYDGTKLLEIYPDTIPIIYSMDMEKKVPVFANITVNPEKQYMVSGTIVAKPDSITIYGPSSKLDTTRFVLTSSETYNKVTDTLTRNIALEKPEGIRLSHRRVVLTIPVEPFTEKTMQIPVFGSNFPDSLRLRTFPGKVEVSFLVGLSQYSNVIAKDILVELPYTKIQNHSLGKAPIHISKHIKTIKNPKIKTDSVEYLIELIN